MVKKGSGKKRGYKTIDRPVGYFGESFVNAIKSKILGRPEKSSPDERMIGIKGGEWAESGYNRAKFLLPVVSERVTVKDTPRLSRYKDPLTPTERSTWVSQNEQIKKGEVQHEVIAVSNPGDKSCSSFEGERASCNIPDDKVRIDLGASDSHLHPTDFGDDDEKGLQYLPSASEGADFYNPISRSLSHASITSPKKVYRINLPNTVYAPKYQTVHGKAIQETEGEDTREYLDPKVQARYEHYKNKQDELREDLAAKRTRQYYNTALNRVAEQYPEFGKDPALTDLKRKVQESTTRIDFIPKGVSWRSVSDKWRDEPDYKPYGYYEDLIPYWKDESKLDRGVDSKLADTAASRYLEDNKGRGITGLTDRQRQIVNALKKEEYNAYNKLREYRVGRKVYSIGGSYVNADIDEEDVMSGKPVNFREVETKKDIIQDLKTEHRRDALHHRRVGSRTRSDLKAGRNLVNRFEIPTTIPDIKYISSVPLSKKLRAKAEISLLYTKDRLSDIIHHKKRDDNDEDLARGYSRGVYTQKPKRKNPLELDGQTKDILLGYPKQTRPTKKKSAKPNKKGGASKRTPFYGI